MGARCDAELGGRQMKRPIASLLGHLLAALVIVSFSATPADTRTICKGPGDGVGCHSAEVGERAQAHQGAQPITSCATDKGRERL
jgi:hypothetical protein